MEMSLDRSDFAPTDVKNEEQTYNREKDKIFLRPTLSERLGISEYQSSSLFDISGQKRHRITVEKTIPFEAVLE